MCIKGDGPGLDSRIVIDSVLLFFNVYVCTCGFSKEATLFFDQVL